MAALAPAPLRGRLLDADDKTAHPPERAQKLLGRVGGAGQSIIEDAAARLRRCGLRGNLLSCFLHMD